MNPIVHTTHGDILGEIRGSVSIFRGIPYGGSCDGVNRFLPPVPAENWDGIRDCTKNGPIAMQFGGSISGSQGLGPYFSGGEPEKFGVADEKQSENCLVLNVLTPGADDKKRPVLVYFHGGGFATGTGSIVLGSDRLVSEEDIVVVGVNHRLNVFGYLYLGAMDKKYAESGMAGILDLVLSLEWVRDNISAFGGDPDNVTIMGESGGGSKVSHLLALPCAKGLFRHAVVESGSNPVAALSREDAAKGAALLIEKLGLGSWRELLTIDAEKIHAALADPELKAAMRFSPVADDVYIAYNEKKEFYSPECSRDVTVAIGCSEEEMACFTDYATMVQTDESLRDDLLKPQTGSRIFWGDGSLCTENNVDRVLQVLDEIKKPGDDAVHLYQKVLSISSFGKGAYEQTRAMAGDALRTKPTFSYAVKYDTPQKDQGNVPYAAHTSDLPLQMRVVLHPEAEFLSRIMANAMGAFVRSGDPSTPEYPWPAYEPETELSMVFDDECRVERHPFIPLYDACKAR